MDATTDPGRVSPGYPRKRARTRRQLMAAAMAEIADHGPDGLTVGAVARRARLSTGTFYNHYADLAAIRSAIVDDLAAAVAIGQDELAATDHDPAVRVALGTRQLLALATDDPDTARAFVRLMATVPELHRRVRSTVLTAVTDGVELGRFRVSSLPVTVDALIGAVMNWMRARLVGDAETSAERECLALALAMVGLPPEQVSGLLDELPAHPPPRD